MRYTTELISTFTVGHNINRNERNPKTMPAKKNFCLFCGKLQSKIARHLETVHWDEHSVRTFSILPKGKMLLFCTVNFQHQETYHVT